MGQRVELRGFVRFARGPTGAVGPVHFLDRRGEERLKDQIGALEWPHINERGPSAELPEKPPDEVRFSRARLRRSHQQRRLGRDRGAGRLARKEAFETRLETEQRLLVETGHRRLAAGAVFLHDQIIKRIEFQRTRMTWQHEPSNACADSRKRYPKRCDGLLPGQETSRNFHIHCKFNFAGFWMASVPAMRSLKDPRSDSGALIVRITLRLAVEVSREASPLLIR